MMDTEKAKNYFWPFLNLFILALVVNLVFFVMPAIRKYSKSFPPTRTITVSAEGESIATPDVAETSFSVLSRGVDPQELADMNNRKMNDVVEFVKSQGIGEADIKTVGYSLNPDYRYDPDTGQSSITGYTLTQTVRVKIRDLGKTAALLAGLTPRGVNQIGGISFIVDDPEQALAEARSDGFRKARVKAEAMAAQNGVKLGRVISINEYQGGVPYYGEARAFGVGGDGGITPPKIEPGTQDVSVQVSVTYELK